MIERKGTQARYTDMEKKSSTIHSLYFRIDNNALPLPPKFCITFASIFSWVLESSQEKSETEVNQKF